MASDTTASAAHLCRGDDDAWRLKHASRQADTETVSMFCNTARFTFGAVIMLLLPAPPEASAQDIFPRAMSERLIGILDLPDIIGLDFCGPGRADLFATPSTANAPIGSIRLVSKRNPPPGSGCDYYRLVVRRADGVDEDLPRMESGYEIPAAIVYQRSGIWFRIALKHGSAWVRRESPKDFNSYPEFLMNHMAFLVEGWELRQLPDSNSALAYHDPPEPEPMYQVPPELLQPKPLRASVNVKVLEVRRARNGVWIRVRLVKTICEGTEEVLSPITGWLRAYRPSGKPAVWFYSRGC